MEEFKERFYIEATTEHRLKNIFNSIKRRCQIKSEPAYKNYGGRGIKCLWKSFKQFNKDMSESYKSHVKEFGKINTTIDRIDNNGNYCKENCRWATMKEQARNRRNNSLVKYMNRIEPLAYWSEKFGIPQNVLWCRLYKTKWKIRKALTEPVKRY